MIDSSIETTMFLYLFLQTLQKNTLHFLRHLEKDDFNDLSRLSQIILRNIFNDCVI